MAKPDPKPATPHRRMLLQFLPSHQRTDAGGSMARNISASAIIDRTLFVACDETSTIERLLYKKTRFGAHRSFNLGEWFDLPSGAKGEMDIEGLAVDGGYLWVVGSHGLKRHKPKLGDNELSEVIKELTQIKRDGNRYFLGRIPLQREAEGCYGLVKTCKQESGALHAAFIKLNGRGSKLMSALKDDEHLSPFINLPCKENGLDIEGLAVCENRAFVGLRGPVLRGWAIVLQLKLKCTRKYHLKPQRWADTGQRYSKHFLDLDGLGIRDLLLDGDDLLILAGPTMDLDGPAAIYRWRGARQAQARSMTPRHEIEQLLQLPCGRGTDHPESMVLWKDNKHAPLLVVYDSPAPQRLRAAHAVDADLFAI